MIKYKVDLLDLSAHIFQVNLYISQPLKQQKLMMPAWIPGSYLIRDFAKQLSHLTVDQSGESIACIQNKTNEWVINLDKLSPITISYQIYAFDKSVRGAYLDNQRGFINGTSLFLCPIGFEEGCYQVEFVDSGLNWLLVTGLSCAEKTNRYEFGHYRAKDYFQLIDCPILMGKLLLKSFWIDNILHDIAISGNQEGDFDRLTQDVQKICKTQVEFFGELPAEIDYYCFLLHVSGEGYGGIEHVNSSSLLIHTFAIPNAFSTQIKKDYLDLLGLFSHEYFHLWMVKQIKPAVFMKYDLTQPNYTTQLWAFEGFTSYYDDLMLVRSGMINQKQYFSILAENINKLIKTPGRKNQTLKSASFNAWIKFYKPDENSINSTISYYVKGALLALCLDLHFRLSSNHQMNLDVIIKRLWKEYGKVKRGVEEADIEKIIGEYSIEVIQDLLNKGLETTEELPIEAILSSFGLALKKKSGLDFDDEKLDFGAKISDFNTMILCHEVYKEGMFFELGIQAGDVIMACQEQKITYQNHQILFQRYLNERVNIVLFREDKLISVRGLIAPVFLKQLEIQVKTGFEDNINKWLLEK